MAESRRRRSSTPESNPSKRTKRDKGREIEECKKTTDISSAYGDPVIQPRLSEETNILNDPSRVSESLQHLRQLQQLQSSVSSLQSSVYHSTSATYPTPAAHDNNANLVRQLLIMVSSQMQQTLALVNTLMPALQTPTPEYQRPPSVQPFAVPFNSTAQEQLYCTSANQSQLSSTIKPSTTQLEPPLSVPATQHQSPPSIPAQHQLPLSIPAVSSTLLSSVSATQHQLPQSVSATQHQLPQSVSAIQHQLPPSMPAQHQLPLSIPAISSTLLPSVSAIQHQLPPSVSAIQHQLPPSMPAQHQLPLSIPAISSTLLPSVSAIQHQLPPSVSTIQHHLPPSVSVIQCQLPPSVSSTQHQLPPSVSSTQHQLPPSVSSTQHQLPPSVSSTQHQLPPFVSSIQHQLPPSVSSIQHQLPTSISATQSLLPPSESTAHSDNSGHLSLSSLPTAKQVSFPTNLDQSFLADTQSKKLTGSTPLYPRNADICPSQLATACDKPSGQLSRSDLHNCESLPYVKLGKNIIYFSSPSPDANPSLSSSNLPSNILESPVGPSSTLYPPPPVVQSSPPQHPPVPVAPKDDSDDDLPIPSFISNTMKTADTTTTNDMPDLVPGSNASHVKTEPLNAKNVNSDNSGHDQKSSSLTESGSSWYHTSVKIESPSSLTSMAPSHLWSPVKVADPSSYEIFSSLPKIGISNQKEKLSVHGIPLYWSVCVRCSPKCKGQYHVIPLEPGQEYGRVVNPLLDSKFSIVSVYRIQNDRLWKRYRSEQALMLESAPRGYKINQSWLYHTTSAKPEVICEEGLDPRLGHGGHFGKGTYFSDNPMKCFQYVKHCKCENCAQDNPEETFKILLCRVLLGDIKVYAYGHSDRNLKREPVKSDKAGEKSTYDSVKGNVSGYDEYVVYNPYRVLPEYLIQYTADKVVNTKALQTYTMAGHSLAQLINHYQCKVSKRHHHKSSHKQGQI